LDVRFTAKLLLIMPSDLKQSAQAAQLQQVPSRAAVMTHCCGRGCSVCAVPPPGPTLPLEAFNRYAVVLDIDGNSWSDRYRLLAHANTPVLKQASNLTAFFEHLAVPGRVVQHYAHDLSDLPVVVRGLLQQQPRELARMAGELQLDITYVELAAAVLRRLRLLLHNLPYLLL
jgi:hypothetical protein